LNARAAAGSATQPHPQQQQQQQGLACTLWRRLWRQQDVTSFAVSLPPHL
jgi:hypothetical protein